MGLRDETQTFYIFNYVGGSMKNKLITFVLMGMMFMGAIPFLADQASATPIYSVTTPINHSADGALSNYPVPINVFKGSGSNTAGNIYLNGHSSNWPYDIRFTTYNNVNIPFWRQWSTSTAALVWIDCNIINTTGTTLFKCVYGNGAGDASNGGATFSMYDHFANNTLNSANWTNPDGGVSISSSVMSMTSAGATHDLWSVPSFGPGYAIVTNLKLTLTSTTYVGFGQTNLTNHQLVQATAVPQAQWWVNGAGGGYFSPALIATVFSPITIKHLTGTTNNLIVIPANLSTPTNGQKSSSYLGSDEHVVIRTETTGQVLCDWLLVRKCTTNEPTWATPGTEAQIKWAASFTNSPSTVSLGLILYSAVPHTNESSVVTALNLPSWATMANNGSSTNPHTISGTPLAPGPYNFKIRAVSINGTLSSYQNWTLTAYVDTIFYSNNTVTNTIYHNNTVTVTVYHNNTVTLTHYNNNTVTNTTYHNNTVTMTNTIYHNNTVYLDFYHNSTILVDVSRIHRLSVITVGMMFNESYSLNGTGSMTLLIGPSWLTFSGNSSSGIWALRGSPTISGNYSISLMGITGTGTSYLNYTIQVTGKQIVVIDTTTDMIMVMIFFIAVTLFNFYGHKEKMLAIQLIAIVIMLPGVVWAFMIMPGTWEIPLLFIMANLVIFVMDAAGRRN